MQLSRTDFCDLFQLLCARYPLVAEEVCDFVMLVRAAFAFLFTPLSCEFMSIQFSLLDFAKIHLVWFDFLFGCTFWTGFFFADRLAAENFCSPPFLRVRFPFQSMDCRSDVSDVADHRYLLHLKIPCFDAKFGLGYEFSG